MADQPLNPLQESGISADIVSKMYSPFLYELTKAKPLTRWGILVLDNQRRFSGPQGALTKFVQTLCLAGDDYGMKIDRTPVVTYGNPNAPQQTINQSCDELYQKIGREKGGPPQLLMFIIGGRSSFTYEMVKLYADTVRGIPSQAIDGFNAQRKGGDRAYHANLLLKVNAKIGGTTVTLQTPVSGAKIPTVCLF